MVATYANMTAVAEEQRSGRFRAGPEDIAAIEAAFLAVSLVCSLSFRGVLN